MTVWTPENESAQDASEQTLLIEGSYELLIGDGYSLLIQEDSVGSQWTAETKNSAS
jgi:hypothetical protein